MMIRDAAITEQIPKLSKSRVPAPLRPPRLQHGPRRLRVHRVALRQGRDPAVPLHPAQGHPRGHASTTSSSRPSASPPTTSTRPSPSGCRSASSPSATRSGRATTAATSPRTPRRPPTPRSSASPPAPRARSSPPSPPTATRARPTSCSCPPRTARCMRNLTSGLTGSAFESLSLNEDFVAGRSLTFDPGGDTVGFFARKGRRRSFFLVSVLDGIRAAADPDVAGPGPGPLPRSPGASRSSTRGCARACRTSGSSTSRAARPGTSPRTPTSTPTPRSAPTARPWSIRGGCRATTRSTPSPSADPQKKTQLTFGPFDDDTPIFSPDGNLVYYSSTEDDDIYNLRSLDLRTGAVKQYSDVLGGNMAPGAPRGPARRAPRLHQLPEGRVQPPHQGHGRRLARDRAGRAHGRRGARGLRARRRAPGDSREQAEQAHVRGPAPRGPAPHRPRA